VQLKEENQDIKLPNVQRGMKGHIIVYPQRPSDIAQVLPPSIDEIITPICVLFVGSSPPTEEWLHKKAKPLCVRREKVGNALIWLKNNNVLYNDIVINEGVLNSLDDEQILPFHVQHVLPSDESETLTPHYDPSYNCNQVGSDERPQEIQFQNVVITDVDAHAPSHQLQAAAVRHVKKKGGGYIEIPHDPDPVNEFHNPDLFPMIYSSNISFFHIHVYIRIYLPLHSLPHSPSPLVLSSHSFISSSFVSLNSPCQSDLLYLLDILDIH
jgi:hypothetical protein